MGPVEGFGGAGLRGPGEEEGGVHYRVRDGVAEEDGFSHGLRGGSWRDGLEGGRGVIF